MTNQTNGNNSKPVVFDNRESAMLTCPRCWTEQRSDRDSCYQCGATFHFLSEVPKEDVG